MVRSYHVSRHGLTMYRKNLTATLLVSGLLIVPAVAQADAWILEPSVSFDLGYDDNYGMDVYDPKSVGISKVTGELALRRLSQAHYFRGGILADAVAYQGDDSIDPNSNQVAYFSTTFNRQRSKLGANFRYRRDTLLREAVSDDVIDVQQDPDASVEQFLDVTRQRVYLNPFWKYNYSRVTDLEVNYQLSAVDHDKNTAEVDDVANYNNQGVNLIVGHSISERDKIITKMGYSFFTTDSDQPAESEFGTTYLRLGYERALSQTFTVGGDIGYRSTEFNEGAGSVKTDGEVASLSAVKTTGLTKFELRAGLELYPSSIGQVVQTQELVANVTRNLSELMTFSLQSRFYQNTALSGSETIFDATASNDRRSLQIRPSISWQLAREWKVGAAYRYRREKLESKPSSAEGNALLFSIKYTKLSPVDN